MVRPIKKKTKKGVEKPYLNAIVILAEITYWYRPKKIFNDEGQLIGYKKKFIEDILQKSYKQLSKKTGLSERAIKDAIVYLDVNGGIKMLFYGGLKMLFFGGNKCLLLADRFFI